MAGSSAPFRILISLSALLVFFLGCTPWASASELGVEKQELFSEALKQRTASLEIAIRVAKLTAGSNYDEAETILNELLRTQPMSVDGFRLLDKIYLRLSSMEQLRVWNRWCSARPTSHFPFTVRGMYFLEKARLLDGANETLLLNKRQRQDFNTFLRSARADLEKAIELTSSDPGAYAALTSLSLHLKLPRSDMEKWFQRSLDIDSHWLSAYRAKLLFLSPWWYGSDQMMEQFARQCYEDMVTGSNSYIVALDYLKLRSDRLGKGLQGARFLLAPANWEMASAGVDRYIDEYPFSQQINTYLSLKERAVEEPYVAIAAFTDNLNSAPHNQESRKGRVSVYLKNRQFREAQTDLENLEQSQGETSFSRFGLGTIAFQSGKDTALAHQLIDAAVALEKSSYQRKNYYFARAEIYRSLGRHPEAISDYSAAIKEDILFEDAYFGRAQARYAQSDLEGALDDLVVIKSTIRGRLTSKARSLINSYLKKPSRRSQYSQAAPSMSDRLKPSPTRPQPGQEIKSNPDNGYREYLVRGLRYFYEEQFEEARKDFYRVISHQPNNSKAYFMLGEIAAHNDYNQLQACVFYKESHRLAPQTPDYLIRVSRCLYRERRFSDAIQLLSGFINEDKTSPIEDKTLAQIYYLRGLCLEENGLMPEALSDMRQASTHDPDLKAADMFIRDHAPTKTSPTALILQQVNAPEATGSAEEIDAQVAKLNDAGRQQLLEGDVASAKVSFLRAIRLNSGASFAYHQLGRLYFKHEQNYEKAGLYYSQAIDRDSQIAHYYFDRAALHLFFKRYDLAREDFSRVLEMQPGDSRSLYYRGVCNHYLGQIDEALIDFDKLRQADEGWNVEIVRFQNAWKAEMDQFLETPP